MAHRSRLRANLAAWANNSPVLNTEYDAIDAACAAAIDGDNGGIWSPAAPVIVGGAGLQTLGTGANGAYGARDFSASMQAQNWPERSAYTAGASFTLNSDVPVAFNQSTPAKPARYCAIPSSGHPMLSEDGSQWLDGGAGVAFGPSSPGGTLCGSIAPGPINGVASGFMACEASSTIMVTNVDFGATWLISPDNTLPIAAVPCYSSTLGMWVLAGNSGAVKTSTTGVGTWTTATTPAGWIAGCGGVKRVVWNGSLFVVLPKGSYNKVLTSPDGVTWTERTIGVTGTWTGLAYGSYDGLWLITGSTGSFSGVVYQSADGLTWGPRNTFSYALNDIAVSQSLWVVPTAGGVNGGLIWSIDKGLTWQNVNVGLNALTTLAGYPRVTFVDNRFLMLRVGGTQFQAVMSVRSF